MMSLSKAMKKYHISREYAKKVISLGLLKGDEYNIKENLNKSIITLSESGIGRIINYMKTHSKPDYRR